VATFRERGGRWQAIVRHKNLDKPKVKTFKKLTDAKSWARGVEGAAERHIAVAGAMEGSLRPLIEKYEREMWPIKKWGETKAALLTQLARDLDKPLTWFTKSNVLGYARGLRAGGLSPSTVDKRLSCLREVFGAARDVWDAATPIEGLSEAIAAARRLKVMGPSRERDRRPTAEELACLLAYTPTGNNAFIDLGAVVRVLSILPLRLGELCGIRWEDLNEERRSALIRGSGPVEGRKHPDILAKEGNIEEVPLIEFGGVDIFELISGRPSYLDRPFPYIPHSVSEAFIQACLRLKIENLHLHDLRAHAISSLLEADVPIPQVAKLSGHKDWKVLKRHYDRIKAAKVHDAIAAAETRAQPPR